MHGSRRRSILETDTFGYISPAETRTIAARSGLCTLHLDKPSEILDLTSEPLIELGPLGTFDDAALLPELSSTTAPESCSITLPGCRGRRVPFHASLGLAISENGGTTFRKWAPAPVMDRDATDPIFVASADIRKEGPLWRCWYTSNTKWRVTEEGPVPRYHIRYAESRDGIRGNATAASPSISLTTTNTRFRGPGLLTPMAGTGCGIPIEGHSYRIGYAESADGSNGNAWMTPQALRCRIEVRFRHDRVCGSDRNRRPFGHVLQRQQIRIRRNRDGNFRMTVAAIMLTHIPALGGLPRHDRKSGYLRFPDSVQFARRSWQQRNRIKSANGELMLTVPVHRKGLRDQNPKRQDRAGSGIRKQTHRGDRYELPRQRGLRRCVARAVHDPVQRA